MVFFQSAVIMVIAMFRYRKRLFRKLDLKKTYKDYLFGGLIFLLDGILVAYAFQYADALTSYAIAIRRTSILFSIIFSHMIFKEKDFKQKMIGSAIMVIGVIIISLLG